MNQITDDCAEQLKLPGSAANANCALRTLRRMRHKAEEWKMIGHAPKIKMMKEHGRHLRLDDEAEKELLEELRPAPGEDEPQNPCIVRCIMRDLYAPHPVPRLSHLVRAISNPFCAGE